MAHLGGRVAPLRIGPPTNHVAGKEAVGPGDVRRRPGTAPDLAGDRICEASTNLSTNLSSSTIVQLALVGAGRMQFASPQRFAHVAFRTEGDSRGKSTKHFCCEDACKCIKNPITLITTILERKSLPLPTQSCDNLENTPISDEISPARSSARGQAGTPRPSLESS